MKKKYDYPEYRRKWQHDNVQLCSALRTASRRRNPKSVILSLARHRAKVVGVPFDLTQDDFDLPTHCPILGIPLISNRGISTDNSPSLDRIFPALGYVKGNVIVMSHLANTIKRNQTDPEVFRKVANFMESQISSRAAEYKSHMYLMTTQAALGIDLTANPEEDLVAK